MSLDNLPTVCRRLAFSFSTAEDVLESRVVSRVWCGEASDDALWRSLCSVDWRVAVWCNPDDPDDDSLEEIAIEAPPFSHGRWLDCWLGWAKVAVATGCARQGRAVPLDACLWLDVQEQWQSVKARLAGSHVIATLRPGAGARDFAVAEAAGIGTIPATLRALWSVHNGQSTGWDNAFDHSQLAAEELAHLEGEPDKERVPGDVWAGVLGGFSCYDHAVCTRLFSVARSVAWTAYFRRIFNDHTGSPLPARSSPSMTTSMVIAGSFNLSRITVVDIAPGAACRVYVGSPSSWLKGAGLCPASPPGGLGTWWSEFGRRMRGGVYAISRIVPDQPQTTGLCLFPVRPVFPHREDATTTFTDATTRGVRVTASTIYCADHMPHIGHAYSIRMELKVLAAGEEAEAGGGSLLARTLRRTSSFPSSFLGGGGERERRERDEALLLRGPGCQLLSRHWVKVDGVSGERQHTRGDGVIGKYPLLRDGGYRDDSGSSRDSVRSGRWRSGMFVYQSCTGAAWSEGSEFGGTLHCTPDSIDAIGREREGEDGGESASFDVVVRPFQLKTPSFIF